MRSLFERSLSANSIVISIPVPTTTAKVTLKKSKGDAKYDGAASVIRWTINKFSGQKEHSLSADVLLVSTTREKKLWARCAHHKTSYTYGHCSHNHCTSACIVPATGASNITLAATLSCAHCQLSKHRRGTTHCADFACKGFAGHR